MGYGNTKFITNEGDNILSKRLKTLLSDTKYFDVLVGYFRLSGFKQIYEQMNNVEKIRILIGINTEQTVLDIVRKHEGSTIDRSEIINNAGDNVIKEMELSNDSKEIEESVELFTRLVEEGKIEVRGYPERNIHAKLYIFKFFEDDRDHGRVITGSSNLSYSGAEGNIEFNVELRDEPDLRYAEDKFNELWEKSVELSDIFVEKIKKETWLNNELTPYEIYLKTLYEYYKDVIEDEEKISEETYGKEYIEYKYQTEAVALAYNKLQEYGGVFISDVVGLGKTYITAMLLKKLNKRALILTPPQLEHNWAEVEMGLGLRCKIISQGKLDEALEIPPEYYEVVVIDEAHKYRNSNTLEYSNVHKLCKGKEVILVTATPRNNYNTDIEALLYLFQSRYNSNILSDTKNLYGYFRELDKLLNGIKKGTKEYREVNRYISGRIRDDILSKVMIRRTRSDIERIYKDDVEKQGLKFPVVEQPKVINYVLKGETKDIYNETLSIFKDLSFAIYNPLSYYTGEGYESRVAGQGQIRGFMRTMFIKRLESSFEAFRHTLDTIIRNHERFIDLYNDKGYVSLMKGKELDKLMRDNWNLEEILKDNEDLVSVNLFKPELIDLVEDDYLRLLEMKRLWDKVIEDHKWENFIRYMETEKELVGKKVIIFTEYKDTAKYLEKRFKEMGKELICYTGSSSKNDKNLVRACFDPNYENPRGLREDIDILVTTDVLAEGINLNKSNVVINYDIPWNPIKVIQRVGRINRINTKFEKLYIYNLFPSEESEKITDMTETIINKIQAFHDILGEDAKYLSEVEEVESKDLCGEKDEIEKMVFGVFKGDMFIDEDEGISTLAKDSQYIRELKDIKENDPDLYKRITRIPKKSRTSKKSEYVKDDALVTFIREGKRKKFYIADNDSSIEIKPEKAFELLYSTPDTPQENITEDYFDKLNRNIGNHKRSSRELTKQDKGPKGYEGKAIKYLWNLRNSSELRAEDRKLINGIWKMAKEGDLSLETLKQIAALEKQDQIDVVERILRLIPQSYKRYIDKVEKAEKEDYEVVLSMYLKKE